MNVSDHADFQLGKNGASFSIGFRLKNVPTISNAQGIYQCGSAWTGTINGILISIPANVSSSSIQVSIGTNTATPVTMTSVGSVNYLSAEHFIRITFNNNWMQIYIDGILDSGQYMPTPTYLATGSNKCYIGGYYVASLTNYLTNTSQIYDMQIVTGLTIDGQTTYLQQNAAALIGSASITQTQMYLIAAFPSYNGSQTTLTLYGGADFILQNAAISNPYYSTADAPYGFDGAPSKWSLVYQDGTVRTQTATTATPYNLGSESLAMPVGVWDIYLSSFVTATCTSVTSYVDMILGLATAAGSLSTAGSVLGATNERILFPAPGSNPCGLTAATCIRGYVVNSAITLYIIYEVSFTTGSITLSTVPTILIPTITLISALL